MMSRQSNPKQHLLESFSSSEEEGDGSNSEFTTSYDSDSVNHDIVQCNGRTVQLVRGSHKRAFSRGSNSVVRQCADKHRKLEANAAAQRGHGYRYPLDHEAIEEILQAARPFYGNVDPIDVKITPLLEDAMQDMEEPKRKQKNDESKTSDSGEDDSVLPACLPNSAVNDLESVHLLHVVQPSRNSTITFREALVPSKKPRLVTLSYPPFIAVHANKAFLTCTGHMSREVLGLPLLKILGVQHPTKSPDPPELDGKLVHVPVLDDDEVGPSLSRRCIVRVSFIAPETCLPKKTYNEDPAYCSSSNDSGGDESLGPVYVTHYGVELEPASERQDTQAASAVAVLLALRASPEPTSFQGVLG
ncbi:expressed unknown protein [Seminavis robusta]|uniref:Uncharacterized protein n=1 Tax=Seminavis robusta TaxID=568900 RepID=A0A9N8EN07_9STRA|nr:expressed unknown protein [Seminavis robusta]|eukprot:Sro1363_g266390.1 n/a (359) ;mRNA; f:21330-22499